MNEPMLKTDPATNLGSAEFFDRARARLGFEIPPGLNDPSIIPVSGDPGNDRMLQIIAQERPIRPAAVLIPVVGHDEPTVLLKPQKTLPTASTLPLLTVAMTASAKALDQTAIASVFTPSFKR